jgi:hypothetical protein
VGANGCLVSPSVVVCAMRESNSEGEPTNRRYDAAGHHSAQATRSRDEA